ncbi:hypothetical protein [Pseudooceanicola spongiae]|uniref:DUF4760 domain-containing protein n=1 Tax=Pseudooceanicola spongiae TaxID=2613965 RepID=A0A7L9WLU2_9RHOB|nr:hypothetical protein [Pseudooceanicola spongiae]QOL80030.1 hypothetical protein F3W81_03835 [Pseudooceanicola spongiae]
MTGGKYIHVVYFLVCMVIVGICLYRFPLLLRGEQVAFSNVSGFATLYGVGFAIIETFRARAASQEAKAAASEASRKIVKLHQVKDVAKCQMLIQEELQDLEGSKILSMARITKILELYTAEFSDKYEDETSAQRINIAALQSHSVFSGAKPLSIRAANDLRKTLMKMLADLSTAATRKLAEESR